MKVLSRISTAASGLSTYARLRRTPSRFPDRRSLLAWQQEQLVNWLAETPSRVRAFEDVAPDLPLSSYPVMDKKDLMRRFSSYNQPRIGAEEGWKAFHTTRMIGPYHVGASTGTSGNRGLYVISERERFDWLGAMLAKTLPDIWKPWAQRERVAVILPLHTRLYDAANNTGKISLRFFNLQDGPESWVEDLLKFEPTTLIAPPKMLEWLTHYWTAPPVRRAYSGAEVLDPGDKKAIEKCFGVTLGQIYMATEGLLGVSCPHGKLHLAEDIMHFELEPVGDDGLVSPIITDFTRKTQVMLRYRMNDLLRISPDPCPCGSHCLVVDEIVGRSDDCFRWQGPDGIVMITPDVLRNAILDSDRSIDDFRLVQEVDGTVSLHLACTASMHALDSAQAALRQIFDLRGLNGLELRGSYRVLPLEIEQKLRRIRVKRASSSLPPIPAKLAS